MADTDAAVLRAFELRNHRLVRVLLLDPFRSSSRMVEVLVVDTDPGEFAGIDLQALENVLRVPTARHSYREPNLRARPGLQADYTPGTVYRFVTWSFDHVLRLPGFTFSFKDNDKGTIVGPAIFFKVQVRMF